MVIDVGVPFVSQRIAVTTKYAFWDYKGNENEALLVMSSEGNDHLMNAETLGKDVANGKRVFA
jgi:hypothetical protein